MEEVNIFNDGGHNKCIQNDEEGGNRLIVLYVRPIQQHAPKKRILHDVYEALDTSRISGFDYRRLLNKHTGTFFIVCAHTDHYHVVHDCTYNNYTYRCAAIGAFKSTGNVGRRFNIRITPSWEYTVQHWKNLTIYFQEEVRFLLYVDLARRNWIPVRYFSKISDLPKKNWWKGASIRSTLITQSPVDPKGILVNRLVAEVVKEITQIPGTKKEERATGSFYSSNNFPHHQ